MSLNAHGKRARSWVKTKVASANPRHALSHVVDVKYNHLRSASDWGMSFVLHGSVVVLGICG